MKFGIVSFFFPEIYRDNSIFHYNRSSVTRILHEDIYTLFVISLWIFLRTKNISYKICTDDQNEYFLFNIHPTPRPGKVPFVRFWRNNLEPDMPQMTIWHMRIARWIPKPIDIHSEYVILIAVVLRQWLLHGRVTLLRNTNVTCHILKIYVSDEQLFPLRGGKFWILRNRKGHKSSYDNGTSVFVTEFYFKLLNDEIVN